MRSSAVGDEIQCPHTPEVKVSELRSRDKTPLSASEILYGRDVVATVRSW